MTRAYAAFAALCIVFGTTFGAIKIGLLDGWPPLLSAGLRFTAAGILVLAIAAWRGEVRPVRRRDTRAIFAIALTVTTATFGIVYTAELVLPSGLAALLSATSPLFALAFAVLEGKRRVDPQAVLGIVLGMAGVGSIAGAQLPNGGVAVAAAIAVVLSEIGYAWGLGRARTLAGRMPMLQIAGLQGSIGGIALLAASLAIERRGPQHPSAAGLLALIYLAVVASAGAHTLSLWLAARTNVTFASSWSYVAPFIALGLGALFLGEPVGPAGWAGGLAVVAGAVLLNRGVTNSAARSGATSIAECREPAGTIA